MTGVIKTIPGNTVRVLNLLTQLESGGAQTVAMTLHRQFVLRGLQSKMVFLYEKDGRAFPQRDYDTLAKTKPSGPLGLIKLFKDLISTWRDFAPTHILAHTYYSFVVAGFLARFGLGGKVVAVHHNVASSYPKIMAKLDRLLGTLGAYHKVVTVSEAAAKTFTYYPKSVQKKIVCIVNAQCSEPSGLTQKEAREKFGFPTSAFIVGTIGRLSEQKNQRFLVDVAAQLPDMQFLILGEGHLRETLVQQINDLKLADRVRLLENMVHEDAAHFLKALDVFALCSLHEGRSIALLEAMGAGLCIVATDVPTIANDLKTADGEKVGIILPLEIDRWADALIELRSNINARFTLGQKAKQLSNTPSIGTMVDQYLVCCDL